mmetsp:Transcript_49119/g.120417  ORF Transcript_49119/g.120417 Transcript_49119/m.120417 type:complete len:421 (-) Transcript_49119:69-1331(-)
MKFGKQLRQTVDESLPEWRSKWVAYKQLKKRIPDIGGEGTESGSRSGPGDAAAMRSEFMVMFSGEVAKVNDFYIDKEEDFIIRYEFLASKAADALADCAGGDDNENVGTSYTRGQVMDLKRKLVEFHGELVLLENYSAVNCTGFRKILKKHDKKSGAYSQRVCLPAVLVTPVSISQTLSKLLDGTEALLRRLNSITKFRRAEPVATLRYEVAPAVQSQLRLWHSFSKVLSAATLEADLSDLHRSTRVERILRALDGITLEDVGLSSAEQLNGISEVAAFLMRSPALSTALTVGCFSLPPGRRIQMLDPTLYRTGASPLYARVIVGSCQFVRYNGAWSEEDKELTVVKRDNCLISAPWPAFNFAGNSGYHVWEDATMPTLVIYATESSNFALQEMPLFVEKAPQTLVPMHEQPISKVELLR